MPTDEEIEQMSLEKEFIWEIVALKKQLDKLLTRGEDQTMTKEEIDKLKKEIEEKIEQLQGKLRANKT